MTLKDEITKLEKDIEQLKQEKKSQSDKWNKILAYSSVVSAIVALLNLLVSLLNYWKN